MPITQLCLHYPDWDSQQGHRQVLGSSHGVGRPVWAEVLGAQKAAGHSPTWGALGGLPEVQPHRGTFHQKRPSGEREMAP